MFLKSDLQIFLRSVIWLLGVTKNINRSVTLVLIVVVKNLTKATFLPKCAYFI